MQHYLAAELVFETQRCRTAHLDLVRHVAAVREARGTIRLVDRFDSFVTRFRPTPSAAPVACAC